MNYKIEVLEYFFIMHVILTILAFIYLYGFNLDYRFLVSGIIILIIGRLLSVYITYKPLKTKYKF